MKKLTLAFAAVFGLVLVTASGCGGSSPTVIEPEANEAAPETPSAYEEAMKAQGNNGGAKKGK